MFKKLLLIPFLCSTSLFAQLSPTLRQTTRYSVRELEDWLQKQDRPNYVTPARFTIGGQVVGKWKNVQETLGGVNQVGQNTSVSNNQFTVDTEIQSSYALGRTFGNIRLKFSNTAGTFNGTANSINLSRAYLGYHFITYGPHTLDVQAGRRALGKIYNSQIMFKNTCDGATLFAFYGWKKIVEYQFIGGVYTSNPGPFWVTRGRLFNMANLGFYFDYAYIFWGKVKPSSNITQIGTKYGVSQYLIGWERKPEWLGTNIQAFAALLVNSRAVAHALSDNKKENLAGYVGLQYGTVKSKGDFSLQGQLQFCQLQAVPNWDVSGIGRGNKAKADFFKASNITQANGNTNYKGWELTLNYALTDQITLTTSFQRSVNLSKAIGLPSSYSNYSLSTAYSY